MGTLSREHHTTITDAALLGPVLEQLERAGKVALHAVFAAGDPMSARLLGVAVGWAPGHAAFVPLRDETSLLRQGLPVALVLERLAPVLARSKVGGHDVKETLKVLVRHGLPAVPTAADSMLASYVLGVSEVHDLGHVVQRHLRANLTPLPTHPSLKAEGRGSGKTTHPLQQYLAQAHTEGRISTPVYVPALELFLHLMIILGEPCT